MKKLSIALVAVLCLAGCDKLPWGTPRSTFVKMCKDDPKAVENGFDCGCQADILQAVLKKDEMTKLIDFINVEKADKNKALEIGKDPSYEPLFRKIAGAGYAIHDKCGKPGAEPKPTAATATPPAQNTVPSQIEPTPAQPQTKAAPSSSFQPATVVGRKKK